MTRDQSSDTKVKNGRATIKTPYSSFKKAAKENANAKRTSNGIQIRLGVVAFGILLASVFYLFPDLLSLTNSISLGACQRYALMIDAGSTGSRIHVYRFHQCSNHESVRLEEEELFAQTIPGLSAYPDNPQQAAESLDVLLDDAVALVPKHLQKKTPIAVKATAGLRLLGQSKGDDILKAVRHHLETRYPFPIVGGEDGVSIMDGRDEGVYAWITVNFLLGNLDSTRSAKPHTAAVLDLGGGSTQIVFEPDVLEDGSLPELPDNDFKYLLKYKGKEYLLYQHSYLGYGLMEARKRMHKQILDTAITPSTDDLMHACLPRGLSWEYTKMTTEPVKFLGAGSYADCLGVADLMLNKGKSCDFAPCSFDGIYQPPIADTFTKGPIYVFSYFYDRTQPLGLPASFRLPQLASLTESICSGAYIENVTDIPLKDELLDRPEWCLDLSFIYRLLSFGYEIPDDRELTVAKKINGVETGWCLGAAIAILGDNSLKDIE
ncbi:nucleoside phosphatase GDA1/CD39 [Parasitella parasitica]|nr:nucleoside phosphatase GDA1/CD39 [Parasitella parasitica]